MKTITTPTPIELTPTQIALGATNNPALSEASFNLGDRSFKLVHLDYDSYITFVSLLTPLFEFAQQASSGGNLSPASVLKYCGSDLPELVRLVAVQTDSTITVADIKRLGRNPLTLAGVVLQQVEFNGMIKDFSDFFGLILPLIPNLQNQE